MVRSLAEELCRQGIEVVVASTDDDGTGRYRYADHPAPAHPLCSYQIHPRTTRFYTFSLSLGRWLSCHVADFDVVHVHALFSHAPVSACYWAARRDVPYLVRPLGVLNRWGMDNRRPWLKRISRRWIEGPLLSKAWAIHCTSESEARQVEQAGIRQRTLVLPNPVDLTPLRDTASASLPTDSFVPASRSRILFLSRVDPKKGLEVTFEGLSRIPASQRPVLLLAGAGDEAYQTRLRCLQRELGLERDVIWLGFLEGVRKRDALATADAFVLISHSENFGIAVAEAMAAGLPVLISDQVGLAPDVIRHRAGLVIPAEADAVSSGLVRIVGREGPEWGRNARACAAAEWALPSVARRIIAVYEEIRRGSALGS